MSALPNSFADIEILPKSKQPVGGASIAFKDQQATVDFLKAVKASPAGEFNLRRSLEAVDPFYNTSGASIHEVIRRLATLIANGQVTIGMRHRAIIAGGSGDGSTTTNSASSSGDSTDSGESAAEILAAQQDKPSEITEAPPPSAEAVEKAEQAAAEAADFVATDPVEQASTLQAAAAEGVPFCEECEKLKAAEAARDGKPEALGRNRFFTFDPTPPEESEPLVGWSSPSETPEAPNNEFANADAAAQAATLQEAAERGAPFCEECEKARQALAAGANSSNTSSAGSHA